jgi:glycosyltransferase involved in cell wall biosynthesis
MHVAALTWRDAGNPEAGGAERFLSRVIDGLVDRGHRVTTVTAAYPGAARDEALGAVRVRRRGGKLSVYPAGALALALGRLGPVDVVLDVQNGVPFFSRVATRAPVVVLVHHVHREQWPVVYGPRAAAVGWWVESRLSPWLYRSCEYVTVSEHTRAELGRLGVDPERVTVVYNGTDPAPEVVGGRHPTPRMVYLGRLVPHKQVEHALSAVQQLADEIPELHLDVVGDGWWATQLHEHVRRHRLDERVTFHGHVDEARKHELLARAWVHVLPSLKEGWGLSVVEAASHGVPTVGYRSAGGLTDSVMDGQTGVLVDEEADLVQAVRRLLTDEAARTRLGTAAQARAQTFTWAETVSALEKALTEAVASRTRMRGR